MSHPKWPSWRYGPKGESAIFESEADVPNGWHDHPSKHVGAPAAPVPPKAAAPKVAAKRKAGGRKPKAKPPLDL